MISVRVIADSVNPAGDRLTTLEGICHRWMLVDFNTHRVFSRNSASSRAIPIERRISQVWRDPAIPEHFGKNQRGMQAREELRGWRLWFARRLFKWARIPVLIVVWLLSRLGLHKQVANRLLEPWVWHTMVFSATEFENFLKQRDHADAQPEFQTFARAVRWNLLYSEPKQLQWGEWHLPYVNTTLDFTPIRSEFLDIPDEAKISAACCARVSYVRQNERREAMKDIAFADQLARDRHFSPLEHPARAEPVSMGNFSGWMQLRKFYPGEDGRTDGLD